MRRQDSLTLDMNWHSSIFAQHLAPAHHSVASWPMARSACILGLFAGFADGNGRRAGMKSVEQARGQAHVCERPNALTVACQRHLWARLIVWLCFHASLCRFLCAPVSVCCKDACGEAGSTRKKQAEKAQTQTPNFSVPH